jgi:hypothetical protein
VAVPPSGRAHVAALLVILVLAAALRVIGLDWGLRHPPHGDETAFVGNVHRMIVEGGLDHRYYEYPGLFFYLLWPVLRVVTGSESPGPAAYLAARGVVAAFGVAAVALQYVFARRLVTPLPALFSAALLAVSLVAVQTAHNVRPDVALQAAYLIVFIALLRVGGRTSADLWAGAALGAAAAVKFSGVFLVPALVARRLLVPERRLMGLAVMALTAAVVFVIASPYSILHLGEFVEGVETQVAYHYEEAPDPGLVKSYPHMVGLYLGVWAKTLGTPATALSFLGLLAAARAPRRWGPLVLVPVLAIAVFSTSQVRHDRFLLPAMVVGFALAAAGFQIVWELSRRLGILVAVVAIGLPLVASARYVSDVSRPGTGDRALDWAATEIPAGARVLTRIDLGLDRSRMEVLNVPRLADRPLVLASEYVVATDRDAPAVLAGLVPRATFAPKGRYDGPPITVYAVPEALRRRVYTSIAGAKLTASSGVAALPAIADDDPATWWHTDEVQRAGDFVHLELDREVPLNGIELELGDSARFAARELKVEIRWTGRWIAKPFLEGRTRPEAQLPPVSQVLLFDPPVRADRIRLTLLRNSGRRWGMAGLRLWHSAP